MPTDETTLEALDLSHIRRRTVAERDYWINQLVIEVKRLRALLAAASLTAPAAPVVPQAVLIAMLDNIEDELRDCTAGLEREPTLRNDLIALADRLNHVVTSLDKSPADRIPAPSEDTALLDSGAIGLPGYVTWDTDLRLAIRRGMKQKADYDALVSEARGDARQTPTPEEV